MESVVATEIAKPLSGVRAGIRRAPGLVLQPSPIFDQLEARGGPDFATPRPDRIGLNCTTAADYYCRRRTASSDPHVKGSTLTLAGVLSPDHTGAPTRSHQ